MICRAYRCPNSAMDGSCFCGYCDEANEEAPVRLKPGIRPGVKSGVLPPEVAAKRNATRKRNKDEKLARMAEAKALGRVA